MNVCGIKCHLLHGALFSILHDIVSLGGEATKGREGLAYSLYLKSVISLSKSLFISLGRYVGRS